METDKSKYGGLEVSEARRLKSPEDEKRRLKKQSLGSSAPTIKYLSAVELPQIAAGVAEDRARDYQALNFAGAFVDVEDAAVAEASIQRMTPPTAPPARATRCIPG